MKVSYIVPGNWADIDLNGDLVEQTRQVGDRFMTYLGQSGKTEQVRDLIDRQFRSQAEALKQAGATNFLVVPLPLTDDVAPMDAMLAIGRDNGQAEVIEGGHSVVMRTMSLRDGEDLLRSTAEAVNQELNVQLPEVPQVVSRQITYFLANPDVTEAIVTLTGYINLPSSPEHDQLAASLLHLYDAVAMNWSAQTDGNWVYVEPGWVEQLQAAPVYADAEVQQAFMEMVALIDRLPADEEAFARFLYLPSQLLAPALLDLYAYPSKGDEAQALTQLITVGEDQQGPTQAEEHKLASGKVVYRSLGAFSDGDDVGHHSLRLAPTRQ